MELQRALSDLEEVRTRLAGGQRFEGYSAPAAIASGVVAIIAGFIQLQLAPVPRAAQAHTYLGIWLGCLAAALVLNYGAVAIWMLKNRGPGARGQFRSAARSIAPCIVLGGALTIAFIDQGAYSLLPGMWFALYAIALFASRTVVPESVLYVTFGFGALALVFLISPLAALALAWWVMPLGFGLGQIGIGYLVWKGRTL